MTNSAPPYVESPDVIRCGQSVILMILKYFRPERDWTFNDADKICGYVDGKWSWSEAAAVSLAEMGFDVICYTDIDHEKFIQSPETYFIEKYGQKQGEFTNSYIDMASSVSICRQFINSNIETIKTGWTVEEAKHLLKQGYLLMTWVNSRKLYARKVRDSGHYVLVYDYDAEDEMFFFHNPGTTPPDGRQQNAWKSACMGVDYFMNAARSDKENGSEIIAFRLKNDK